MYEQYLAYKNLKDFLHVSNHLDVLETVRPTTVTCQAFKQRQPHRPTTPQYLTALLLTTQCLKDHSLNLDKQIKRRRFLIQQNP